jgi:hypothetical protein
MSATIPKWRSRPSRRRVDRNSSSQIDRFAEQWTALAQGVDRNHIGSILRSSPAQGRGSKSVRASLAHLSSVASLSRRRGSKLSGGIRSLSGLRRPLRGAWIETELCQQAGSRWCRPWRGGVGRNWGFAIKLVNRSCRPREGRGSKQDPLVRRRRHVDGRLSRKSVDRNIIPCLAKSLRRVSHLAEARGSKLGRADVRAGQNSSRFRRGLAAFEAFWDDLTGAGANRPRSELDPPELATGCTEARVAG